MRWDLCRPKLAPRLTPSSQTHSMITQSVRQVIVQNIHQPSNWRSSHRQNHHSNLDLGRHSPSIVLFEADVISSEAVGESFKAPASLLPMLSNACIVVEPFTHVQRHVLPIKLVIEFGVVVVGIVVGIMPVISDGRRGRSRRAVARGRVVGSPTKSVSCDRKAML